MKNRLIIGPIRLTAMYKKYSRSICKIFPAEGCFKLKWHIANPEELAFVKVLTTKFFMKSLKSLEELLKVPFVKSKLHLDDWKHNLDILVSGLEGVASHEKFQCPLKKQFQYFAVMLWNTSGMTRTATLRC